MESNSLPPNHWQKVNPVRVFEQAVEQIRALIKNGTLATGEKLPTEQELGKQLNVSRSSIREALRVLETEGLVEVKRGSGTYISTRPVVSKEPSEVARWLEQREETLEQILQVRESIEGLSASLAASRITVAELDQLHSLVDEQTKRVEEISKRGDEDFDRLAYLDSSFHLMIAQISGNDIAIEIISHIIPSFNESNKAVLYFSGRMWRMEKEHRDILNALTARDIAAAEKAMRTHIERVRKEIISLKEKV